MLEAVVDLPWRAYPAAAVAGIGVILTVLGVRLGWGFARHHDPARNLAFMRGFRLAIVGLALVSISAAWTWHLAWLLVLALAIGGEELLESSIDAYAIRRGIRLGYVPARSGAGSAGGSSGVASGASPSSCLCRM